MNQYFKDFDTWNSIKKMLDQRDLVNKTGLHEGEIWWCALGINIGSEQDGKNEMFERPVLILKKINPDIFLIAPLTSKIKTDKYRMPTKDAGEISDILLSQMRTVSHKRLLRRVILIKIPSLQEVLAKLSALIIETEQSKTP